MGFYKACWLLFFICSLAELHAQDNDHVSWNFSGIEERKGEWIFIATARLEPGWHLYSQSIEEGGPMPVSFHFDKSKNFTLVGKTKEFGTERKSYDSTFLMKVTWFEESVVYKQKVKPKGVVALKGRVEFSVCSEETCVPNSVAFTVTLGETR